MTKKAVELVSQLQSEIENLQRKLAAREQEGWEGSQRRLWLKREAKEFIEAHGQS